METNEAPAWLDREAKKIWKKLSPQLQAKGELTPSTSEALGILSEAFSTYLEATAYLDLDGRVIDGKFSPWNRVQKQNYEIWSSVADTLGLVTKKKKPVEKEVKPEDELEDFLKGA